VDAVEAAAAIPGRPRQLDRPRSGRISAGDAGRPATGTEIAGLGPRRSRPDEDISPDMGRATPTKPAQAPPGPLTRARTSELNFVMIFKNEGPEVA